MSAPTSPIALPPRRRRALAWMLRGIGLVSLSALGAILIPHEWMDRIHRAIGLGDLPDLPMVAYLARSLSLFYAWLGAVAFYASFDIERHLGLIRFFATTGLTVGVIQTGIDLSAPLPGWWTLAEGGFLFGYFGILLGLARRS